MTSAPLLDPTGTTWDVVIVGSGPAGAATAITLAKYGQRVLLVEKRGSPSFKLGESLPPASMGLVRHFLGDPESPEQQLPGLFRTAGNISLWGTEQAEIGDFFFTSTGHGLCVDRLAFDEALRTKALAAGATLVKDVRFQSCTRIENGNFNWQLTLASRAGTRQVAPVISSIVRVAKRSWPVCWCPDTASWRSSVRLCAMVFLLGR